VEFITATDHFDEFPAPQFEIYFLVVVEDRGVRRHGVFEGFVDVAFKDGRADFYSQC